MQLCTLQLLSGSVLVNDAKSTVHLNTQPILSTYRLSIFHDI